jgi:hypothetical protein
MMISYAIRQSEAVFSSQKRIAQPSIPIEQRLIEAPKTHHPLLPNHHPRHFLQISHSRAHPHRPQLLAHRFVASHALDLPDLTRIMIDDVVPAIEKSMNVRSSAEVRSEAWSSGALMDVWSTADLHRSGEIMITASPRTPAGDKDRPEMVLRRPKVRRE